jgi:hypothetical protein
MNERIKQLAEQAGFGLWQDESWNPGDVIDWSCRYDDEFKKFAELIVRDCALTAGIMEYEGRAGIGAQLLDNFGVEE